jgi:hypothetical protein
MKRFMVIVLAIVLAAPLFAETTTKEKLSAGFDVMNRSVSMRIWAGDAIAYDAGVGLSYENDLTTFDISGGAVFPVFNSDGINGLITAGLIFGFGGSKTDITGGTVENSLISVAVKTGLEFEAMLTGINKNLSIGAGAYFTAGAARTTTKTKIGPDTDTKDETDISVNFLKGFGVAPVIIRYYF